jgi:serine/threonine protein kinase/dipeptidyl aminopeptidase/acylaminoacyl peptidase
LIFGFVSNPAYNPRKSMAIQIGQQLGSLEITALLGEGGMGVVYRARDTKLGRDVAVKVLPDAFASDSDRLQRFQREAQVLASLNHTNIAQIYGLEESEKTRCIVMELVDGETLQERLKRGPVPADEALRIAKQIAEALEAAHEKGITHRDLKPANIKVSPDGNVKVLDFGLAKAVENVPTGPALSNSPTMLSMAATGAGMILGTAPYMSPEQAKGRAVDRRTDIFAFGCVLYEMLTGRPAFEGEDITEILGRVVTAEPDWTRLPASTPELIKRLLRRALTKDPRQRLGDIRDARLDLEEAAAPSLEASTDRARASQRRVRVAWFAVVLTIAIATLLAFFAGMRFRETPSPPEIRVDVNTPSTTDAQSFAISPDGRRLVFLGSNEGKSQLWVRPLDSVVAQPLAGTEGATFPFWSPDSASFGFFADGKLKRIDLASGATQVLANAINGRGGTWNGEGTIVFAPTTGPLLKVPATGGDPLPVTRLEKGQGSHRFPQFLPDGRHFIYFIQSGTAQGIYVGSLDGSAPKLLATADAAAVVSYSGFLLFLRQTTLFAQAFDFNRQALSRSPFPVVERPVFDPGTFSIGFSASSNVVAYRNGASGEVRQLTWIDRSGKSLDTVGAADAAGMRDVEMSPDGKRVAVFRAVNGNTDVWVIEVARGVPTRLTFDALTDSYPVWSSDGSRIFFSSTRKGVFNLYSKSSSGAGTDELLFESDYPKSVTDKSPDGRFLLFVSAEPQTGYDLWVLPLSGDQKPFPFLRTAFQEFCGQFSPDGKWIAYQSNESGQFEIYVQPFPGPGGKFQISTTGGAQPRWNKNGKEIFYVSLDSKMMAAHVKQSTDGQSLETGTPVALFPVRIAGGPLPGAYPQQYSASSDGQRFLVNLATDEDRTSPITLIYNWHPPKP